MDVQKLASIVEALLFVSGDPVSVARLAEVVEVSEDALEDALKTLQASYEAGGRGLFLIWKEQEVMLASHPDCAMFVERFVRSEREGVLSRAALETLSIIAYRGPIGRADIDAIRGVNSTMTLRNLLLRGLVERHGNPDDARGYLYSPTFAFLEKLGLSHCSELPDFQSLSADDRVSSALSDSDVLETQEESQPITERKKYDD